IAIARVCVTVMISGVPVGAQIAWLSSSSSGWAFEVTRVAAVIHCALTHGPFPATGGGKAQPATTYGATIVTVGCPDTVTRGFGAVGCAWPPCAHITVAPTCSKNPGILTRSFLRAAGEHGTLAHRHLEDWQPARTSGPSYTTTRAPLLTVTVGPTMTMLAPFPFWM